MGEEHHDEHIDLIERSTGDDTIIRSRRAR